MCGASGFDSFCLFACLLALVLTFCSIVCVEPHIWVVYAVQRIENEARISFCYGFFFFSAIFLLNAISFCLHFSITYSLIFSQTLIFSSFFAAARDAMRLLLAVLLPLPLRCRWSHGAHFKFICFHFAAIIIICVAFQLKSTWANANVSISIDNKCNVIHSVTVSLSQCLSISTSIFRVLFTPKRSLSFNIYICNVYVAVYNVMHGICAFGIEMWMGESCERPQFLRLGWFSLWNFNVTSMERPKINQHSQFKWIC